MAPTRSEQREQARQAIEEAATALFAERGFEATSVQQVATRAGVSKGLVHHYFPKKEALVTAVIEARQRALTELGADAPAHLDSTQKLGWFARRVIDDVAQHPERFRLVLRAMTDPGFFTLAQQLVSPAEGWSQLFADAGAPAPRAQAAFFRAALLGVMTTLATAVQPPDAQALTTELLALLPQPPSEAP